MNTLTSRLKKKVIPACTVDSLGQTFIDIVTDNSRPPQLAVNPEVVTKENQFTTFCKVTEERVRQHLEKIQVSKATGSDGISGMLLKT